MNRLRDLLGARLDAEVYLSTEEAAQLVGKSTREALIKWCRRHNVPLRRPPGGRTLAVKKSDLDWALRVPERPPVTKPFAGSFQPRRLPKRRWAGSSDGISELMLTQQHHQEALQQSRDAEPAPRPAEGDSSAGHGPADSFVKRGAS